MTMTAGVFSRCGVYFGRTYGRPVQNYSNVAKRFSYNNLKVADQVITPYMQLLGADPRGQLTFPDVSQLLPVENLATKVESTFKFDGYKYGAWAIKDPRLLLTWPMWVEAFPEARWVIVRREVLAIVTSCLHTKYMNAHSTAEGWQGWVEQYYKHIEPLRKAARISREVWPTKFIEGQFAEIKAVVEGFDGLKWNETAVRQYLPGGNKGAHNNG